ncbi:aminopeptidase [Oricola cellulosilytica]|uniref:Aminopeptidase n=1 Tax=Oricola cellulosilytica TaxID=1429082 RepID=A0A4R0PAY9_9HYPH|nr:aminopeptidase [Oricola cellulosilytica]TCD14410.1 aminopeptidase [Oricola cellulosilytica]
MTLAFARPLAALSLTFVLSGCTGISYYVQSVNGHLQIVSARQPVDELIADPEKPAILRAQMALASDIRQFASEELALPDNDSYRSYVDTHRDYVTWAVFAAPELSLEARTWCFPVYGCVPYRGYFSEETANRFAAQLRRQGLDVHVAGITAYSTLGWSSDPLLNTMFGQDEAHLAGLVFHELAHQQFYARGDSAFNEGFAVVVETTGVTKWLTHRGDPAALRRYRDGRERRADFLALVAGARDALAQIYDGPGSEAQKRAAKAAVIEELRSDYRRLRDRRWSGFAGYDAWFDTPIGNAKIAAAGVYNDLVPAFERLFDLCAGDHARFYRAVQRLGALDGARRADALKTVESW